MAKADSTPEALLSCYHFLGLEPDASFEDVTRAYEAKLAECDPFRFPRGSEERQQAEFMIESINVAYHKIVES